MLTSENRKIAFDMVKEAAKSWRFVEYTNSIEYQKDNMSINVSIGILGKKVQFIDYKTPGPKVEFNINIIEKIILTFTAINRSFKDFRKRYDTDREAVNTRFEVISGRFLGLRND